MNIYTRITVKKLLYFIYFIFTTLLAPVKYHAHRVIYDHFHYDESLKVKKKNYIV